MLNFSWKFCLKYAIYIYPPAQLTNTVEQHYFHHKIGSSDNMDLPPNTKASSSISAPRTERDMSTHEHKHLIPRMKLPFI